MYKLVFVCLALLAVASAQFLASPYAYSAGFVRPTAYAYGAYPYASTYGAYGAYPYAYGYNHGAYLYK